jgi:transposase
MGTTAHSDDLRSRMVAEILAGTSRRQAAERFNVSATFRAAALGSLGLKTSEVAARRFFKQHAITFQEKR